MKKLMGLMVLNLAMGSAAAFAAEDITPPVARVMNVVEAKITKFDVDGRSGLPVSPVTGNISVNYTTNIASLYLDTCPAGAFCIIGGRSIDLPIVSVTTDRCGVKYIKAEKNLLAVDGDDKILTIADTTQATCRMIYEAPTMVTLKIIGSAQAGPSFETLSKFQAEALEQMMFALNQR